MARAKKTKCKKICASDADLEVARRMFRVARGCAAKNASAEAFLAAASRHFKSAPKATKKKLMQEGFKKQAAAARTCGDESAARRLEAEARARAAAAASESAAYDREMTRGDMEGLRSRRRRRRTR